MPYANVCRRIDINPGEPREPEPGVRLQWSREAEHVQISIQPMTWGREQPNVDGGDLGGLWATVGRYEINQLIKHLRTARDQAFGRDE